MSDEQLSLAEIAELPRDGVRVSGALFGQWWCVPVDMTQEEQARMVCKIKEDLGSDFAACPNEYIGDRLYGGFPCNETSRRHVYWAGMQYSYLAAEQGRYWPNDPDGRADQWAELIEYNGDQSPPLDGPFTTDAPRKV